MAKRSVQGYRPLEVAEALRRGRRFFPDSAIEAIIEIADEPPLGPFTIPIVTAKGEWEDEPVNGRAALQHHLEIAAYELARARLDQSTPTPRQRAKEFKRIELAARRLLNTLQVGPRYKVDNMPTSLLSSGLLAFREKDDEKLNRGAGDLLQDNVRGVVRLARLAKAARLRQEGTRSRPKRNEGDKALDQFVGSVVATCWWTIYGREITDGPKLIAFVQAAMRGVGEKPSADAVRERFRRVFGRRGKPKTKQL
jgi:hypothetical protein